MPSARLTVAAERSKILAFLLTLTCLLPASVVGQGLKLAVGDVGLGLGDVPRLDGIRLNYRDANMRQVRGLNLTLWAPHGDAYPGTVTGIAVGLPLTGAADVRGLALGGAVNANQKLTGLGIGLFGMGAGEAISGVMIAGFGMGSGGDLSGIMVGGLGAGAGGDSRGVLAGGLGAGISGDVKGLALGGLGLGVGGDLDGIAVGGLGVGASGRVRGIIIGGLGVGAGGDVDGIALGGLGVGAGGELKGLAIGGVGVGAQALTGVAVAPGVGARDVHGLVLAPLYFKAVEGGTMRGVSVSAFNRTAGRQEGLTIGLLNIADELHGVQIGLLNIARNKARYRVMPLVNWN